MKILHISNHVPNYHKLWGGAEQLCLRISKLQEEKGLEVTVASIKPEINTNKFPFQKIITQEDVLPGRISYLLNIIKTYISFDFFAYYSTRKIIEDIKPNIIHCHNIQKLSLSVIAAAKHLGVPVVFSVYDFWCICPTGFCWKIESYNTFKGLPCFSQNALGCLKCVMTMEKQSNKFLLLLPLIFLRKYIFSHLFSKVDRFVILSPENRKPLERMGVAPRKIKVAHIPFYEEITIKPFIPNSMLFVGWWYNWKGLHRIIEAMPLIIKEVPKAKLFIIGTEIYPIYVQKIKNFIDENNLGNNIVILGKMPFEQAKNYIQTNNVLIVPEQWETIAPNILTEGMIFGRPIVASNIGGIKDLIRDGENGLLAAYDDSVDFAKKIIFLLKNPEQARKMGEMARRDALQTFSAENVFKELTDIYKELI